MTTYTLRILKAVNGWTVMEGSHLGAEPRNVLVCEGDPPPQVIVKPQPAFSNQASAAIAAASTAQLDLEMAKKAARQMANALKDA